ncbi:MAG: hypothetical protein L6R42_002855 [Xanthoria sp. 1 TBL-2021]|nr:MAG: hypothetical protein L6R42_002855 [Xanthoria sp. 1 TBL-2021]
MAAPTSASSTSRRPRPSGQGEMSVGSFRRLEEIGKGSFATVYKATYSKSPGYVAIKSVDMNKLNKKLKENLYSEIHILKRLHHPHIVALIDCQETTAHIHLVMEFCQLGDLSYFIKKRDTLSRHEATADMVRKYPNPPAGGLNEVVVRHFLKQLASALEFLREGNFIHRDVKPQNLLLDPSPLFYAEAKPEAVPYAAHEKSLIPVAGVESLPTLKIADFGFARSLPSTSLAETLCGSPLYMAPEILRYEKYDAKADLWSVGTVLYEMMVGKPPFRAANHVELLRKIERSEDRIRFPEETTLSDSLKRLIRRLLRRNPVERISFADFFNDTVIKDQIPGLVEEDKPAELPKRPDEPHRQTRQSAEDDGSGGQQSPGAQHRGSDGSTALSQSPRQRTRPHSDQPSSARQEQADVRNLSGTPPRATAGHLRTAERRSEPSGGARETSEKIPRPRRPSIISHTTAPARQDVQSSSSHNATAAAVLMQRQLSSNAVPSQTNTPVRRPSQRERLPTKREDQASRDAREAQERAAQDVAFERDYVLVEKRAVEVNAFADQLATEHGGMARTPQDGQRGAMVRRATTQGPPTSVTGAQVAPSRALQIASGKRPDHLHHRQNSYERRIKDSTSATSAISKAINMASGRLLNMGFSPPLGFGRSGQSPPSYNPFPAYPTNQGSMLLIGDGTKGSLPLDEDSKAILIVEESATRSDVVYGFAEVKYKQLIPVAPSMDHGLGLRQVGISEGGGGSASGTEDEGLTAGAVVTLSEEALVLYVKALSLLARSMDIAGAWWARKSRGVIVDESASPKAQTNTAVGNRVNNVVQWVRSRFNEVLGKAEFVRLKLIEAQQQLPPDHPSHPSNHPAVSRSVPAMGTSADNVVVSVGVTAEKLMYDRALEMSRSAAVNELVGEDLPGCEIAYVTAIRMLEAVLEDSEESGQKISSYESNESRSTDANTSPGEPMEAEDRKVVLKMVTSIRARLAALKKKMQVISKRTSTVNQPVPSTTTKSPANTAASTASNVLGGTPPR